MRWGVLHLFYKSLIVEKHINHVLMGNNKELQWVHVYRDYDTEFIKERIPSERRITVNGRDHEKG